MRLNTGFFSNRGLRVWSLWFNERRYPIQTSKTYLESKLISTSPQKNQSQVKFTFSAFFPRSKAFSCIAVSASSCTWSMSNCSWHQQLPQVPVASCNVYDLLYVLFLVSVVEANSRVDEVTRLHPKSTDEMFDHSIGFHKTDTYQYCFFRLWSCLCYKRKRSAKKTTFRTLLCFSTSSRKRLFSWMKR